MTRRFVPIRKCDHAHERYAEQNYQRWLSAVIANLYDLIVPRYTLSVTFVADKRS